MNLSRRRMLHHIALGSSAGITVLAGCSRKDATTAEATQKISPQDFLVICHGMFLFQFASDPKTKKRQMIAYMPAVPSMGLDGGHIYKASSQNSPSDLVELMRSPPAVFDLVGPASASSVPSGIGESGNLVFRPSNSCPFDLTGKGWACKIMLPMPDDYLGWRQVYSSDPKQPLFSTTDSCVQVPGTVFSTHVFRYTSPGRPALIEEVSQKPIWPRSESSGTRLHLFAQPLNFADLVKATGETILLDHTIYMNGMFKQPPRIMTADPQYLCEREEQKLPWGLLRPELLDLNELPSDSGACMGQASSRNESARTGAALSRNESVHMTKETIFHVINGQLLNCRSYFLIQS
jgi:hypothetical protein